MGVQTQSIAARTGMGAVELAVTDADRALRFYRDYVGLTPLASDGPELRLGAAGREIVVLHPGAERPVVLSDGPRAIDDRPRAPAPRTLREPDADQSPRRQWIAASIAYWWRNRTDRSPADLADRPARGMLEQLAACGATRGQDNREYCV